MSRMAPPQAGHTSVSAWSTGHSSSAQRRGRAGQANPTRAPHAAAGRASCARAGAVAQIFCIHRIPVEAGGREDFIGERRSRETNHLNLRGPHGRGGTGADDAGRPADAERVYGDDLARHPDMAWSLIGLAQALQAEGRTADVADARARFEKAWARADVKLEASRF